MEYLIPAVLVVLLVGGLVVFLALRATQKGGPVADEGAPGIGRDATPLGDTTEHAGAQTERGTTGADPEAGAAGRTDDGDARRPGEPGAIPEPATSAASEGEGAERLERERPRPASERLADRDA